MTSTSLFPLGEPDESFLEFIPVNFRGSFKNLSLLNGPRAGVVEPSAIEAEVRRVLSRRTDPGALAMINAMDERPDELRSFLAAILDHDRQPEQVRLQRKQLARHEGITRYMAAARPTHKQLQLLYGLGFSGDVETRLQASQQIEFLLSRARQRAGSSSR